MLTGPTCPNRLAHMGSDAKSKVNRGRLKATLYGAASVIILLIFLAVMIPVTANPIICGSCHSMWGDILSWKNSSHAKATCTACHLGMSPASLFNQHVVGGARRVYLETINRYDTPINKDSRLGQKELPAETCLRCHSFSNRKVTPRPLLTMNRSAHVKHLEAGLSCTICHNRVVHDQPDEDYVYFDGMDMMKGCFRCHNRRRPYTAPNGKKAPTACAVCHDRDGPGAPGHLDRSGGRPWKQAHGSAALGDMAYCQRCHGSDREESSAIPSCFTCHDIDIPHPTDWRQSHPEEAVGTETVCRVCHRGETDSDFCRDCHHGQFETTGSWISFAPGVSQHPKVVKKIGGGACFQCHRIEFCAECHLNKP
jgi:nitrate/TMAO reductase-like tetraheme cytochrome c subunit